VLIPKEIRELEEEEEEEEEEEVEAMPRSSVDAEVALLGLEVELILLLRDLAPLNAPPPLPGNREVYKPFDLSMGCGRGAACTDAAVESTLPLGLPHWELSIGSSSLSS